MSDFDWGPMYQGTWNSLSEREQFIEALATEYHEDCDLYDDMVCTGRFSRGGGRVPASIEQSVLINRHAKDVMSRLLEKGMVWKVTQQELTKSIRDHRSNQR
jgi:hypothetical protein